MTNPLLTDWTGPFALPPFDAIGDADFGPAFDAALAEGRAAVAAIAANPEAPNFANTIEAMERADCALDRVSGVFYNLVGSDSNPWLVWAASRVVAPWTRLLDSSDAAGSGNGYLFRRVVLA